MKKYRMKGGMTVALAAIALTACGPKVEQYTIEGKIGGLEEGTVVVLGSLEVTSGEEEELASDTVRNGSFLLQGKVDSPLFCHVTIKRERIDEEGKPYPADASISLMLENAPYTIEAAHVDSIPLEWEFGRSPIEKEQNVTVTGGRAQQEYNEYRQALIPYEKNTWAYNKKAWEYQYNTKEPNADSVSIYTQDARRAERQEVAECDKFVQAHPQYAVSVYLTQRKMTDRFTYTVEELDAMLQTVSGSYDTARVAKLAQAVEEAKQFAAGVSYKDFSALTEQGKEVRLADYVKPGVYTLVDFWASWCGPCRAAIPHVKGLKAKYADRLNVLSVSLDRKEDDWKKALKEEQMSWAQLLLPADKMEEVTKAYSFNGIPYLVLFSPEGKIVRASHDPLAAEEILEIASH